MRIAFAGTPEFAARALEKLISAGHQITLVLTQPDRPSGRGMKLKASAVKQVALAHDIPVLTPRSLSASRGGEEATQAIAQLQESNCDVLVVAAYGLILPQTVLDIPRGIGQDGSIKCLNIHASLLPRWRGAAPIQRAIEAGDTLTGVCLMKMEAGLDTGPVVSRREIPIADHNATTLTQALTELGAEMVVDALASPKQLSYSEQAIDGITYAQKLLKTEGFLNWTMSNEAILRTIRAFHGFPCAKTSFGDLQIKIHEARACDGTGQPGEIIQVRPSLIIACGQGAIECIQLQKPGKPAMPANSFAQSSGLKIGDYFR